MTAAVIQYEQTLPRCAPLHIELLNHFRITSDDALPPLGHASERLVAYVALEDRHLSRDRIAGALWPDTIQSRATANLRRALSLVRRHAPGLVRSDAHCLLLVKGVSVDARTQRSLIEVITGGERTTATADELRLLRGDLLPDWDEPWLVASRQELRQLRLISLEAVAAAHLDQGRPASALAAALCVTSDEPLRESAHRLVIQAHLALGNWAEATRQYMCYRTLLWAELQLRPGACMEALIRPVLRNPAYAG